ncbi:MAG: carboxymuconolactone decarboxylase family protein [Gaiellaceae bacterium]
MPSSMAEDGDRIARGRTAYASQLRLSESEAVEELERVVGERMASEAINAAGGAWAEDVLSLRDRSLVVVTALLTQGGVDDRLRVHTRWALDHGLTADELEAMATLLAVYVGYPRASVAIEIIRDVVAAEAAGENEGIAS